MRGGQATTFQHSPSVSRVWSLTAAATTMRVLHRHSRPTALKARYRNLEDHYQRKAAKYWDEFYKRHQNKVTVLNEENKKFL